MGLLEYFRGSVLLDEWPTKSPGCPQGFFYAAINVG